MKKYLLLIPALFITIPLITYGYIYPQSWALNTTSTTTYPYPTSGIYPSVSSSYFTATSTTATSTFAGAVSFPSGMWDTLGNVGIGTVSPSAPLFVQVASTTGYRNAISLFNPAYGNGDSSQISFMGGDPAYWSTNPIVQLKGGDSPINGSHFGYFTISINFNGGVDSNEYTFGYDKFTAPAITTTSLTGLASLAIDSPNGGNVVSINAGRNVSNSSTLYNTLYFSYSPLNDSRIYQSGAISVINTAKIAGAGTSQMTFSTENSGTVAEQMRIDNNGNVGIGTTGPRSKLDVKGGISVGSYAGVNAAPSNGMIISGNVGIGTTNPGTKLEVVGTASSTGLQVNGTATITGALTESATATSTYAGTVNVTAGTIVNNEYQPATSSSMTLSWLDGTQQLVKLGHAAVTINFSGVVAGGVLRLPVCQDGTGGATVTWDSRVLWASSTAPTLSGANHCDLMTFDSTNGTSSLIILGGYINF